MTNSNIANSSSADSAVGYGGVSIHVGDIVEDVREDDCGEMVVVNMLRTVIGVMKDHNVTYLPAKWFRKAS